MSELEIDVRMCRSRQRRLLSVMEQREIDLVVVTRVEHVQWLAGPRFGWVFEPAAALAADGHLTLVAPRKVPETSAADDVLTYESNWHSTMRNDQRAASSAVLLKALTARPAAKRIGVEFSSCGPHLTGAFSGEVVDVEPDLYCLRRRKDSDELARLRKAIAGTGAMYARAREIVKPGVNELEVFNELQSVAVEHFGEMLTGTGNDYASGERGGPPRNRKIEEGELYILDLGPAYRGYFADNCRTIAVGGKASDEQLAAWECITKVFPLLEKNVRPGKSCRALFDEVQHLLDEFMPGGFNHHLGHGIGLFPHEAPHLNPNWDDTFEAGDVFTAEPGLYSPDLRAGIRLENDYLVTANGVEPLCDFPLEL